MNSAIIPCNYLRAMNNKVAAFNYARSGKPVFPCHTNKAPKVTGGFKSASRDFDTIDKWWSEWPDALIGLPTGKASGLLVLDIDVKNGANGFETLAALEAQYSPLPETLTVETPSGGEHRYFKMPETDPPIGNSAGKLGPGLDVRGERGYVIAPPSQIDEDSYKFKDFAVEPALLPDWPIQLLTKPKDEAKPAISRPTRTEGVTTPQGKAELDEIVSEMANALEGARNDTLNRLAFRCGQLVAGGEVAKGDCMALVRAAVSSGLSYEEVRPTFSSGYKAGLESPAKALTVRAKPKADEVIIECADDMDIKPIDWLWPGWLPQGKLTILAGQAGTGKSTLALSIAATITAGGQFPDGFTCKPGNILMWSGEDAPEDTLIPRLCASGADLKSCFFIQGTRIKGEPQPFNPASDIPLLEAKVKEIGEVSLLIVDPVVNAVAGDMNKANEVRQGLGPLVDFGASNNCAVLGITHFRKGKAGSHTQERVIGSQAFSALARMVLVVGQEEGKEKRVLARAKCNIAPDNGGFEYTLRQATIKNGKGPIETTYAVWGNPIEGTASEILEDVEGEEAGGSLDEAEKFLREILAQGEKPHNDIVSEAEKQGYSFRTLKRAKAKLKIKSRKDGKDGPWFWALPETPGA